MICRTDAREVKKMNANIRRRRTIILIIAVFALFFATGVNAAAPKGVTQIKLMTDAGEIVTEELEIYVGTETQLTSKVVPVTFKGRKVSYEIADEQIASVDENGSLKAIKEGETLLTVECAGARKNYTIKAKTAVEDITGLDDEIIMYEGDELQLEPEVKMAEKGFKKPRIKYEVKRNTIATVDNTGRITAISEGETTVTVTAGDVTKKVKLIVEAAPTDSYTPVVRSTDNSDNSSGNTTRRRTNNTSVNNGGSSGGSSTNSGGSSTNSGGSNNSSGGNSGSSGGDSGSSGGDSGSSGGDSGSSGGDSGSSGGDSGSTGGDSGSSGGDSGSSGDESEN